MFHNGQEALLSAQKKYIPEIFLMRINSIYDADTCLDLGFVLLFMITGAGANRNNSVKTKIGSEF